MAALRTCVSMSATAALHRQAPAQLVRGPAWSVPARPGARVLRGIIAADGRGGSSVVDKPSTVTTPNKSTQGTNKRPPIYKVLLHNDTYNKREYVVQVLLKVVEGMTMDDAMQVMQEAHEEGMALVIACSQEEAEVYCETLRMNGLTCTLEPGC